MGKVLLVALALPLAIKLMYDSGSGFDPSEVLDQRVLVTGASSGIGEQLAYKFAKLGARLVITARRADLLQNVSRRCQDMGSSAVHFVAADMASPGDRSKVIEHVQKHLGGLDQLVLNHAIMTEGWWTGSAENFTFLEHVHRVNFLSYVDIASKALPMLTASRGRIGVVSSGFGEIGSVIVSVYASCKFALNGFFSSLRQELRHKNSGVSVTLVVLGPVASDSMLNMTDKALAHMPRDYMIRPEDAAQAILESVASREYKTYFDWKTRMFSGLIAVSPKLVEDWMSHIILNDQRMWMARLTLLWWRYFF